MHSQMHAEADPDPREEVTPRERIAAVLERRLDPVMAFLALSWLGFVLYELGAPADQRNELVTVSNVVWGLFAAEFVVKLVVSGSPVRYVRRRWLSVLFLVLPALRIVRAFRALRAVRLLPSARVLGSGYRAVGTAARLLQGRLGFLVAASVIAVLSGGQLLFVLEVGHEGGVSSLGEALWWSANLAITSTLVFEPVTIPGRMVSLLLSAYSVIVFAAVAATLGAYFVEARQERAADEAHGGG